MPLIKLAPLLAVASTSVEYHNRTDEDITRLFNEFQERHGHTNSDAAFDNFRKYVELVDSHPTNKPLTSGNQLSPMALLSEDDFVSIYRACSKVQTLSRADQPRMEVAILPSSVDWREQGAVTPVKDQGQCGSCWAFSTSGLIESAWAIAGHGLQQLSEQELVSCDTSDGNAGCGGGWPYLAVDYVRDHGIDTEASYPYTSSGGQSGSCQSSSGTRAAVEVVSFSMVQSNEDAMAAWLAMYGPLSISIDAMTTLWWPYTSGILTTCTGTDVDHAVLITGFGVDAGQPYWNIKNSWNQAWGEGGYIRLQRGSNQCGITYQPVGATVVGTPTPSPAPDGWMVYSDVYYHSSQQIDAQDMTVADAKVHCASLIGCVGFTAKASPESTEVMKVYFERGLDTVYAAGWSAFRMPDSPSPAPTPVPPSPVPPSPMPVPSPSPSSCPSDAQQVTVGGQMECLWTSGTGGLTIPSSAREYCDYLSQGYLGYTWESSAGDYSCAPSARKSSNGATNFCVWEDGSLEVSIPSGSAADCGSLSQGRIGWLLPGGTVSI